MLIHILNGEKIEVYRVVGAAPSQAFNHVGTLNVVTGQEAKPFIDGLDAEEKAKIKQFREAAFNEYLRIHSVDAGKVISDLINLSQTIKTGLSTLTAEQESQLTFAFQRLRNTLKAIREGK